MAEAEALVLSALSKEETIGVDELVTSLSGQASKNEVLDAIRKLEDERKIRLFEHIGVGMSFRAYLSSRDYSLWFQTLLAIALGTVLSVYLIPPSSPIVVLRWILGSVYILFLPGFVLVEALFPRRSELDGIERMALYVGLSLAVTPLVGYILNYTPFHIRLEPVMIGLSAFTLVMSFFAAYRKYRSARTLTPRL